MKILTIHKNEARLSSLQGTATDSFSSLKTLITLKEPNLSLFSTTGLKKKIALYSQNKIYSLNYNNETKNHKFNLILSLPKTDELNAISLSKTDRYIIYERKIKIGNILSAFESFIFDTKKKTEIFRLLKRFPKEWEKKFYLTGDEKYLITFCSSINNNNNNFNNNNEEEEEEGIKIFELDKLEKIEKKSIKEVGRELKNLNLNEMKNKNKNFIYKIPKIKKIECSDYKIFGSFQKNERIVHFDYFYIIVVHHFIPSSSSSKNNKEKEKEKEKQTILIFQNETFHKIVSLSLPGEVFSETFFLLDKEAISHNERKLNTMEINLNEKVKFERINSFNNNNNKEKEIKLKGTKKVFILLSSSFVSIGDKKNGERPSSALLLEIIYSTLNINSNTKNIMEFKISYINEIEKFVSISSSSLNFANGSQNPFSSVVSCPVTHWFDSQLEHFSNTNEKKMKINSDRLQRDFFILIKGKLPEVDGQLFSGNQRNSSSENFHLRERGIVPSVQSNLSFISPCGRIVCFLGSGNLGGRISFFSFSSNISEEQKSINKNKEIMNLLGKDEHIGIRKLEWHEEKGNILLTASLYPYRRVDNKIIVWKYNGEKLGEFGFEELVGAEWVYDDFSCDEDGRGNEGFGWEVERKKEKGKEREKGRKGKGKGKGGRSRKSIEIDDVLSFIQKK